MVARIFTKFVVSTRYISHFYDRITLNMVQIEAETYQMQRCGQGVSILPKDHSVPSLPKVPAVE
jgi:hypothetical protein